MGGELESAKDLCRRLEESLARFGVAGFVTISGTTATLDGNGPTVTADVGATLSEWPGLGEDARQRQVNDVARRLAAGRRSLAPRSAASKAFTVPIWLAVPTAAAAILGVLFGARAIRRKVLPDVESVRSAALPASNAADAGDADDHERRVRAERVCNATRSRVMRGATVGPSDVEGWIVELWALRDPQKPSPSDDPALGKFVASGSAPTKKRIVWAGSAPLSGLSGPNTFATVLPGDLGPSGAPVYRGFRVVLEGGYVGSYFDEGLRPEFSRFARALTDALGADYAALYARCAEDDSHYIGSWFRGPSPGGAMTSLLFFMGTFGDRPEIRGALLAPSGTTKNDGEFAFRTVANVTEPLKKTRVMTLLGPEGGMIAGVDRQVSTVTFPFRDANRAGRATTVVARELGIADGI